MQTILYELISVLSLVTILDDLLKLSLHCVPPSDTPRTCSQ